MSISEPRQSPPAIRTVDKMIQSPNERRLDGCRDAADENACRPHREPRYVIFPAANTAEAPNRAGSPQGQAHEDADTAPVAPGVKRSMSVRNLLSTPALFRRKPSQASTRQAPPSDGAVRAMTMRKGSRDMPPVSGRPSLERSSSAPGWWRQPMPAENMPPGLRSPPARRPSHARDPSDADQASLFVKRKPLAPHHLHKLIIPVPEDEPWRCRSPLSRDVDVVDTVDSPPPPPPKGQASRKPRPVNMLGSLSNVSSASLVSLWTPGTTTATTTTTATEDGPDQARSEKGSGEAEPPSLQALASEPSSADRGRRRRRRDGERVQRRRSSHKDALSDGGLPDSLPAGVKLVDVPLLFEREDIVKLHEQALGQAARFEVLSVKDVDELSKELRLLDQKCEYLWRTQLSLRSGRQALHSRTLARLHSTDVAALSRETLIGQARALAGLDLDIDGWVGKLDRAENRRTRVRQKLLEHVAAASTLKIVDSPPTPPLTAPLPYPPSIVSSSPPPAKTFFPTPQERARFPPWTYSPPPPHPAFHGAPPSSYHHYYYYCYYDNHGHGHGRVPASRSGSVVSPSAPATTIPPAAAVQNSSRYHSDPDSAVDVETPVRAHMLDKIIDDHISSGSPMVDGDVSVDVSVGVGVGGGVGLGLGVMELDVDGTPPCTPKLSPTTSAAPSAPVDQTGGDREAEESFLPLSSATFIPNAAVPSSTAADAAVDATVDADVHTPRPTALPSTTTTATTTTPTMTTAATIPQHQHQHEHQHHQLDRADTESIPRHLPHDDMPSVSRTGAAAHRFDRNDVQSIRIYADANVCALFAEVEREIGLMTMVVDDGDRNGRDRDGRDNYMGAQGGGDIPDGHDGHDGHDGRGGGDGLNGLNGGNGPVAGVRDDFVRAIRDDRDDGFRRR